MKKDYTIAVTGNPNCGKTTLFNALTGSKQYVGNWPGVTVEQKSGVMIHNKGKIEVVDTPGIYSMTSFSIDEKVTRDYILSGQADVVVNIIDATNVERSLYLLTQLLEMRVPVVVALNMMDAAKRKKIKIEIEHFSLHLDCPVIPIVASENKNLEQLKDALWRQLESKKISSAKVVYDQVVEEQLDELVPLVESYAQTQKVDARWLAVKALEEDEFAYQAIQGKLDEDIGKLIKKIEEYVAANQSEFPKDFYKTFELDPSIQFDVATFEGMGYGDFSWGCTIVEIEYDPDTYQVDVQKSWSGIDVGKRVNQEICEGQIQGGILQAIGWGSTEYVERAGMRGSSITDYIAYTSADAPELNVYFTDNDASRPKGLGELPMDFPAAAVRDALHNATGIFLPEIPVIPENIRNAIKK